MKPHTPFLERRGVIIGGMIVLPITFVFVAWVCAHAWVREDTDDAFVDGNIVLVAPRVAGRVITLAVNDNELVTKGSPLFEIDPADFAQQVDQDQQAVFVDEAAAESKKAAYDQAQAHVDTAKGFTTAAQAAAEQAQADANRLQDDLARDKALVETKVISFKEYDDSSKSTTAAVAALKSRIAQQTASVSYENESVRQLESAKAQWKSAVAQVGQAQAALGEARLQLSYAKIPAPVTGRVTERTVNTGDYVQIGQQVMALVPPEVWITANFKETQLDHMRPGQPVEIHVDAYPHTILRGHVDSVQAGSGSRFSLLPPENATGNYVKVVQRVPVKILLDEPGDAHVLGPGMSVEPTVLVNPSGTPLIVALASALAASGGVIALGIILLRRHHAAH